MILSRWRSFFHTREYALSNEPATAHSYGCNALITCACGSRLYFDAQFDHDNPQRTKRNNHEMCACGREYRVRTVIEVKEPIE